MTSNTGHKNLFEEMTRMDLSVVLPCYNEAHSVEGLHGVLKEVLERLAKSYEIIFVDDGSTDQTFQRLSILAHCDPKVIAVQLRRNFGQSAAMQAGFDIARGDIVVSLDADMQDDPNDIPLLLEKLEEGYDIVSGWRKGRGDAFLTRKLPSLVANRVMSILSGVDIHDFGATLKAYRKEVIKNLELAYGHHRFIPALASTMGVRVTEVPIARHPRSAGKSKYGLGRVLPVFFDLIVIKFLLSYLSRPMQLFGTIGFTSCLTGFSIGLVLVVGYYTGHLLMSHHYGNLLLSVFLMLLGFQFFGIGLLAELNARIYRKVSDRGLYMIRRIEKETVLG